MKLKVEIVVTKSRDHLNITRKLNLVLNISRRQIGLEMVIGVRSTLAESDRRIDSGLVVRGQNGRRRVVEKAGVAEVIRQLAPHFGPGKEIVPDAPGRKCEGQVRLIKYIPALR